MNEVVTKTVMDAAWQGGAITIMVLFLGWFFLKRQDARDERHLADIKAHGQEYKGVITEMATSINNLTNAIKDQKK